MLKDPIMQTEPRWRMACWHQPCSTCRLLSANIRATGDVETYVLPSNGMVRSFRRNRHSVRQRRQTVPRSYQLLVGIGHFPALAIAQGIGVDRPARAGRRFFKDSGARTPALKTALNSLCL